MKVLHVIPSISALAGGPSQAMIPMCRALAAEGIDVVLATTDDGLDAGEITYGTVADFQGVPTIFFPVQIGKSFKYSRSLATWLAQHVTEFDLVHIHAIFNHACIVAARACRKLGVPYLVRPLGTLDPWSMKQKSWRKKVFWHGGIKRMLSAAAGIHYTARAEQAAVEDSLGLNHGFVVPLGVVIERPQLATPSGESDSPYVLVLSRLHPKKNLELLIDAFCTTIKERPLSQWRLMIAGDGDPAYVQSLKQLVRDKQAGDFVVFTGWLSSDKKAAALANASLVALPSSHENFGLCIAEAMASGVPVLVSPYVNLAEEIERAKCGWVVELDHDSLVAALASIMESDGERVARGRAGHELAHIRFSWPVVARELSRLYSSTLTAVGRQSSLVA